MGSTESKMAAPAPAKAQPAKQGRVGELMDPRSPSAAIDRTPIQVTPLDSFDTSTSQLGVVVVPQLTHLPVPNRPILL